MNQLEDSKCLLRLTTKHGSSLAAQLYCYDKRAVNHVLKKVEATILGFAVPIVYSEQTQWFAYHSRGAYKTIQKKPPTQPNQNKMAYRRRSHSSLETQHHSIESGLISHSWG